VTNIRLKYVQAFADRHGARRYYFRRAGTPRVALPSPPGGKAFMAAYAAALEMGASPVGAERTAPGSITALIVAYYESAEFRQLAPITQSTYRGVIERFREDHGARPVRTLQTRHIAKLLDDMSDRPGAAHNLRRVLRILMRFAVERNWRTDNPALNIKRQRRALGSGGYRCWTDEDIVQFEGYWTEGSRARLALALLLYTGQRRADVVGMGQQHVSAGRIHVCQSKGGARLAIPIHKALADAIAAAPLGMTFIVTAAGKPMSPAGFTNWFRDCAREAGLPERSSPHGLRKAAARRLAEAGCTLNQIMSVTGHKTMAEVAVYTAAVDQVRLADSAMLAVSGTKSVNPRRPV
jgi:integrase